MENPTCHTDKNYLVLSHSLTALELFNNFDFGMIPIHRKKLKIIKGEADSKQEYVSVVFKNFFHYVILDMINNNTTFVFPKLKSVNAFLYIKPIRGVELQRFLQVSDAWNDVDLLKTNFTLYQMQYSLNMGKFTKETPIYVTNKYKDIFIQRMNEGKQYY